jgi:hypothetical protein
LKVLPLTACGRAGIATGSSPKARRTSVSVGRCSYGIQLLLYLFDDVSPWGGVSNAFWFPITLFKYGRIPVLAEGPLFALDVVWKLSLLACALGFRHPAGGGAGVRVRAVPAGSGPTTSARCTTSTR